MITILIKCDNCGKGTEKKYSWIRDFNPDDFRIFYESEGFSDSYSKMDVCPSCKDKFEDVSFRE